MRQHLHVVSIDSQSQYLKRLEGSNLRYSKAQIHVITQIPLTREMPNFFSDFMAERVPMIYGVPFRKGIKQCPKKSPIFEEKKLAPVVVVVEFITQIGLR